MGICETTSNKQQSNNQQIAQGAINDAGASLNNSNAQSNGNANNTPAANTSNKESGGLFGNLLGNDSNQNKTESSGLFGNILGSNSNQNNNTNASATKFDKVVNLVTENKDIIKTIGNKIIS